MRGNVTFRCTLPIDLDKHPPGEELAEWIAARMTAGGLATRVIDNYEDFAWWIESESDQRMPWALLGYVGDGPAEWLLLINSSVGWLGRLLGRSDEAGRRPLARACSSTPRFWSANVKHLWCRSPLWAKARTACR